MISRAWSALIFLKCALSVVVIMVAAACGSDSTITCEVAGQKLTFDGCTQVQEAYDAKVQESNNGQPVSAAELEDLQTCYEQNCS